jgi:hypothetical protein
MADTCAIEDCDRSSRVRGWCDMHYRRWKITGDPTKTIIAKRWTRSVCSVDGCDRYVAAQSYCDRHYRNWRRNGTPLPPDPPMGYKAVHQRLRAKRGPAADHLCVECACDVCCDAPGELAADRAEARLREVQGE